MLEEQAAKNRKLEEKNAELETDNKNLQSSINQLQNDMRIAENEAKYKQTLLNHQNKKTPRPPMYNFEAAQETMKILKGNLRKMKWIID